MRYRQDKKNAKNAENAVINLKRSGIIIASGAKACAEAMRASMFRLLEAADKGKRIT